MMQRSNSAGIVPNVSRTKLYEAFGSALRLYIGRGRRHSYKEAERGAGVSARMIEAYRYEPDHEEWRPAPIEHIFSIAGFIGPDFTNEILPLIGQGAFYLPDDDLPPGDLAADMADDNAEVTRRAKDGSFKGDEKALKVVGRRMMSRGAVLVALDRRVA